MSRFDARTLLDCYRNGIFPMAESRDDTSIFLVDPEMRGIIPLDGLHISRSLRKVLRREEFKVTYDKCFDAVIMECARTTPDRKQTWINDGIEYLYNELHHMKHAHSVEVWKDGNLVGGLYGVSIGGAFFGESMFSRTSNASKVALVKLVERLNAGGYKLLDTQFITDHLATLGAIEIPRDDYKALLADALTYEGNFHPAKQP